MLVAFSPGRLWLMESISTNSLSSEPTPLGHEAATQVGHHAAEAGGADDQELDEYLTDGGLSDDRSIWQDLRLRL